MSKRDIETLLGDELRKRLPAEVDLQSRHDLGFDAIEFRATRGENSLAQQIPLRSLIRHNLVLSQHGQFQITSQGRLRVEEMALDFLHELYVKGVA